MTTLCKPKTENLFAPYRSLGVSDEATSINSTEREMKEDFLKTATAMENNNVIVSMIDILGDCSRANWDGYGAKPILKEAFYSALKFWLLLPRDIATPEVDADPNGSFIFEWRKDKTKFLAVVVEKSNRIVFAGNFGENKVRGYESFDTELPEVVVSSLMRIYEP